MHSTVTSGKRQGVNSILATSPCQDSLILTNILIEKSGIASIIQSSHWLLRDAMYLIQHY